ncbi:hypothetical protein [Vibrio hyugaensis]|uniref:hypothetical protein n=1 Tax=Vibrio hyugaensis TaxID=1534743 RepID=UPI0006934DA6|nr:hypothetical protein [Vibrio hyugaensis]
MTDKLIELGLVFLVVFAVKRLSKSFEYCLFTPKTIDIDSNSNTIKYRQDSTVYFRAPLDETTKA